MAAQSDHKPSRAASNVLTLLVVASLGLNGWLAAQLCHRKPSLPPLGTTDSLAPGQAQRPAAATVAGTPALAPETNVPPPFRWSEVESRDYRQYIANLRAVGCPEQVIRDILVADLNQAFAPRFKAILKPEVREYWRKTKHEWPSPEQEKQLVALARDKRAVLQELLGVRIEEQQIINTLHLQVFGNEQNLLFLPSDRREAALQALADADFEMKSGEMHAREGYSSEVDRRLFHETLGTLANVLTPAELEEFRLRGSPAANALRNEVQYFNCTAEEFRQLVDAREQAGDKNRGNLLDRTAATVEAQKLLGDERAKEFERVTDSFYINARRTAEEQGLSLGFAEQVWQVTRDTRDAAKRVGKSNGLSADERTRQLQSLQQQAETRLNTLLGPKAALGIIRDLRNAVNVNPAP